MEEESISMSWEILQIYLGINYMFFMEWTNLQSQLFPENCVLILRLRNEWKSGVDQFGFSEAQLSFQSLIFPRVITSSGGLIRFPCFEYFYLE